MRRLWILGAALACSAFRSGSGDPTDTSLVVLWIACVAAFRPAAALRARRAECFPALASWFVALLIVYMVFQLIPLPAGVVQTLSPARAELGAAVDPVLAAPVRAFPIALSPAEAFQQTLQLAASVLLLFLIAEITAERVNAAWAVAAPIIAVAAIEAVFGCLQHYLAGGEAHGTWPNRNHFASFLGMCLPFATMYAWQAVRKTGRGDRRQLRDLLRACGALSICAVLLLGVMFSFSRMGFAAAMAGLAVSSTLVASRASDNRRGVLRGLGAFASLSCAILVAFLFLAPPELVSRFAQGDFSDGISKEDRVQLWNESLVLVHTYPLFGTGLGGYESAFLAHKVTSPLVRDKYAHNEYLQYLLELGALGCVLAGIATISIVLPAFRSVLRSEGEQRALTAACCGALTAVLLHAGVDFMLHVQANTLLVGWTGGIVCALSARSRTRVPLVRFRAAPAVKPTLASC